MQFTSKKKKKDFRKYRFTSPHQNQPKSLYLDKNYYKGDLIHKNDKKNNNNKTNKYSILIIFRIYRRNFFF